jgi:hypothetical protein
MQSPGAEGLERVRCLHVLLMLGVVPQRPSFHALVGGEVSLRELDFD